MANKYGLGLVPSPVDHRDFRIEQLLTAPPEPLPPVYRVWQNGGVPLVINQGKSPMCVAYASSGVKSYQEIRDEGRYKEFDEPWLYQRCKERDGIPFSDGTYLRVALKVLKDIGLPSKRPFANDAAKHKIAAYYSVPVDVETVKRTLTQYGPVLMGSTWYNSWFTPKPNGVLPDPDIVVGGHATYIFGWDDNRGFYVRNSWGKEWGPLNGNFLMPYDLFTKTGVVHDLWKSVDVLGDDR